MGRGTMLFLPNVQTCIFYLGILQENEGLIFADSYDHLSRFLNENFS